MKKQVFSTGFLILLMLISFQVQAQSEISVNTEEGLKNVSEARTIALSNTVLSVATGLAAVSLFDNHNIQKTGAILGVYGVIVAPSTGNFYASDSPRGVIGIGARAVGSYLMIDATREVFGQDFADVLGVDDESVSFTDTKILIGEGLILGSIIYNVLSTKASVEEYNDGNKSFNVNMSSAVINGKVNPTLTASIRF